MRILIRVFAIHSNIQWFCLRASKALMTARVHRFIWAFITAKHDAQLCTYTPYTWCTTLHYFQCLICWVPHFPIAGDKGGLIRLLAVRIPQPSKYKNVVTASHSVIKKSFYRNIVSWLGSHYPASILRKSTSGRHRPVSYPDGPMTARYRFT